MSVVKQLSSSFAPSSLLNPNPKHPYPLIFSQLGSEPFAIQAPAGPWMLAYLEVHG